MDSWLKSSEAIGAKSGEDVENKPWNLVDEDKDDVFGLKEEEVGVRELGDTTGESSVSSTAGGGGGDDVEREKREEALRLEREKQELTAVLKGTLCYLEHNFIFGFLDISFCIWVSKLV